MTKETYIEILRAADRIYKESQDNEKKKSEIRVGDADTPLSIKEVIEDIPSRTVVVRWNDGKVTHSKADADDTYDFEVGLGLCIAKKLTHNIHDLAESLKKSKTRYKRVEKKEKK